MATKSTRVFSGSSGPFVAKAYGDSFLKRCRISDPSYDLKLFCGSNKFIRVHRSLFMALSPFLCRLIVGVDPNSYREELEILLPDISYAEMQLLVNFIYLGEVQSSKRNSRTLIKWLKVLGIPATVSETPVVSGSGNDVTAVEDNPDTAIFIIDDFEEDKEKSSILCQLCNKVAIFN